MKQTLLITFLSLTLSIVGIERAEAQFTIEDNSSAESIVSTPEIKVDSTYDITVVTESLLKQQQKEEFNTKNYLELTTTLTASQASFSNWVAGGDNSFSGRASLYARHVYKNNKFSNDSYLNTAYGLGESSDKLWKTEDRLELNNTLGYQMYNKWDYSMNINFMSQFANGFTSQTDSLPVSSFLAPGTLNVSLGVSYTRNDNCKISLMPLSGNVIFIKNQRIADLGLYGDAGEKIISDIGAYINITWEEPIYKDVITYKALASSFSNYKTIPNLSWQSWINISVAKYFTVAFYCYLVYDKSIVTPNGKPWQMNQTLGFGLSYTFKNRETL